ncbi:hypothetical protein DH2020_009631 [Rehmannia glutinosa]|uniref:Phytol kinase n=1 Tax=Rehmannia glutinosa TaxID=99300 RepID=A0ABR0X6U4_REHGL
MPEILLDMYSWDSSSFTDIAAGAFSYAVCHSVMHLLRKLVHISVGLIVMLCWPMFSSGRLGRIVAGFIPSLCLVKAFVAGSRKDDKLVKFLIKYRDSRTLLVAALGYALATYLVTVFEWRTPLAIATICNLCAGDGIADIAGRRFGSLKLPYNKNKSFAGTIGMAIAGFFASILYMYYFSWFGYIQESPNMVLGLLVVSVVSALVESHPLSTKLDDNLTVPLASMLVGKFVL